jgi:hypothetical protein
VQEKRTGETGQDGRGTVMGGAGDLTPGTGSPLSAREQGTAARLRPRHLRRQMLAAAVATAAAAGGTTALLAASAGHPPTALATVTSALADTSADSYSFSLHSTVKFRGSVVHSDVVSGAYDPRHGLGTELLATRTPRGARVRMQIRFIRRYVYSRETPGSGFRKPWNESPVPSAGADAMPGNDVYGFVTDQPVIPAELSGVLRSAGTLREVGPASGQGWTGTRYAFTARFPGVRESVSGTVDIDRQGRVRRLVTITTRGAHGRITTDRDLTFGNFGAPVPVTVPPASQVGYTSRPYSGFLF